MTTHCLEMVFICIFNNILCGNIYVPRLNTEIHSLVKLNSVLAQASRMSSKSAQKNVNVWTSTIPWQLSKLCPLKNTVWYSQKLHNRQASGSWWETGFDNCLTNKVDFFLISNFSFLKQRQSVCPTWWIAEDFDIGLLLCQHAENRVPGCFGGAVQHPGR